MVTRLAPNPEQIFPKINNENKYSNPENNSNDCESYGLYWLNTYICQTYFPTLLHLALAGSSFKGYTKNNLEISRNVKELVKQVY